jgi:hypothetical protein
LLCSPRAVHSNPRSKHSNGRGDAGGRQFLAVKIAANDEAEENEVNEEMGHHVDKIHMSHLK